MKVHVRQVINLVNIQEYHPHVDTDLMVLQNKKKDWCSASDKVIQSNETSIY